MLLSSSFFFFFFNDTATTEIYTLSLHDALPISSWGETMSRSPEMEASEGLLVDYVLGQLDRDEVRALEQRSEEHTSELQSQSNLVCRLLLEKKKKNTNSRLMEGRQGV